MIGVYPVLRQRMREQQLSMKDLATAAGISRTAFFMKICGIKRWKLTEAVKICCFFRTQDVEHLFVRKHYKSQKLESQGKF